MSRYTFKVGDRVRVIAGPRLGAVTVITSGPIPLTIPAYHHANIQLWASLGVCLGELIHHLDLGLGDFGGPISAPPRWLEPYRDDANEPAENVETWIADLCKSKEPA